MHDSKPSTSGVRLPRPRDQTRTDQLITAIGLAAAVVVLVVGIAWLQGTEVRWDWQKTFGWLAVLGGAAGVIVGLIVQRFWRWPGIVVAVLSIVAVPVALTVVVDELRLGGFSESEHRPVAGPELVPVGLDHATPEPSPLLGSDRTLADVELGVELIFEGLEQAVAAGAVPGSDAILVAERVGRLYLVNADERSLSEPILNLAGETDIDGERGVLDFTFNPSGERLYVSYTNEVGDNQVSSWVFRDGSVDLATRLDVISVEEPYETHNGGAVRFGHDGYLYLGIGDGGRLRDPLDVGQNRSNRLGTILRILPDETVGGYLIPPTNPYLDEPGVWPEIYVYGARNPWRFSFDSATGDLWVGDVGQAEYEEVHYLPFGHTGGANFGWRRMVADEVYLGPDFDLTGYTEADRPADHTPPVWWYEQNLEGIVGSRNSIVGGYVYRGTAIPDLWGTYLYADFSASILGGVVFDEDLTPVDEHIFTSEIPVPVAFGVDAGGEILVVSIAGSLWRLVPGE